MAVITHEIITFKDICMDKIPKNSKSTKDTYYAALKVHSRAQTWYLSVRKSDRRGVVHSSIWTPYIPKCAYDVHKACFTAETFWPRQSSEYVYA